ncbi:MAG: GNAT family N-acetyltransferase [Pseudomonadales bacterium]
MNLLQPAEDHLDGYLAALRRGWSANTMATPDLIREELERIEADPVGVLAAMDDREAKGPPIRLPDGTLAKRLPGFRRWLWDGEFCGSIGLRWQPGTTDLPPHCLGHIGYAVVPWKRGRGYATTALRLLLPEAWSLGLPFVELTTDRDNLPSQRVIEANAGVLVERFTLPTEFGATPSLRYRIFRPGGDR